MLQNLPDFFAAVVIGLLGGAHCIGMCGGIIGALSTGVKADSKGTRYRLIAGFSAGRIGSYVAIAIGFYTITATLESYFAWQFMRLVAGLLLIAMGLYLGNWWRGLTYLETVGSVVWRLLQPFTRRLLPVTDFRQALLLGMLWGWLPCGLIYSALVYAATASSWPGAGLIMLGFGLGTLPAVLLSGIAISGFSQLLQRPSVRQFFGLLLIAFGLWTLWSGWQHGHHNHDSYSVITSEHHQH